jgi:hypothetical protein
VTALVEEEDQPTKQRTVLCKGQVGVHNPKAELFVRCLKCFSVGCLSVTTSRGTVDQVSRSTRVGAHLIPRQEREMQSLLLVAVAMSMVSATRSYGRTVNRYGRGLRNNECG